MTPDQDDPEATSARVLHVGDADCLASVAASLECRGSLEVELVSESSVEAGLSQVRNERIDCVVSPVDAPEGDGLSLLGNVRDSDPAMPFVLYTDVPGETVPADVGAAGASSRVQEREVAAAVEESEGVGAVGQEAPGGGFGGGGPERGVGARRNAVEGAARTGLGVDAAVGKCAGGAVEQCVALDDAGLGRRTESDGSAGVGRRLLGQGGCEPGEEQREDAAGPEREQAGRKSPDPMCEEGLTVKTAGGTGVRRGPGAGWRLP